MEFLAKGKRGIVYTKEFNGKIVVVKKENPNSTAIARIETEARILQEVNKLGIGPQYISHTSDEVVMEFIQGKRIGEFIITAEKQEITEVLINVMNQCFLLDKSNLSKEEMHHPHKHILIGKRVVMLDWERSHKTLKPTNVTQFCQYITSSNFGKVIKEKGIDISKFEIIQLAKIYKENINKNNIKKIIQLIKTSN